MIDWDGFFEYLLKLYKRNRARERFSYARQYAHCLVSENLSDLMVLSDDKRGHVLKALSVLAKYLGVYEKFKQLVRSYGLKWSGKAKDDLLIQRLTKVIDPESIFQWVKQIKADFPDLALFFDFITYSGMRLVEAVESYNLIIQLHREGKLSEYYNCENCALENYKFKNKFIRRTKKSFVVFMPKEIIEKISCSKPLPSAHAILQRLQKRGLECKFGDIREAHATLMTQYLKPPEIDFIHGRIGISVFMQNYFNPALISDLKERVFKGIAEIQSKIT
ncbi:MAG: integrase [Candidatus Bathyarchaeia archaeon]